MKPIAIDDFCSYKFLSNVEFSPEGTSACFVVAEADKEGNKYSSNIYSRRDGTIRQLTSGGKESSFIFLDDDTILFRSNREENKDSLKSLYYKLSLSGGEAVLAYTLPVPCQKLIPLKNGDFLALCSVVPGFEELYKGEAKLAEAYKKHLKDEEDYEVVTQSPWWWNGGGFHHNEYTSLYYFDVKKNKLKLLTGVDISVSDVKLSKDQKTVYYSRSNVDEQVPDRYTSEIIAQDLASGKKKTVVTGSKEFSIWTYELGESFILLIAADDKFGLNTDPDFYTISYDTYELKPYAKYGLALGSSVGSDVRYGGGKSMKMVGDTLWFISTSWDIAGLYKLENGQVTRVYEGEGSVDCFDIHGGDVLMTALLNMKPQELYNGKGKCLSHFNDKQLKNKYVAQPEKLNFVTDGHEIHGFVLKPLGYEEDKKYPVILDIHGGPKTVYGPVFYHEMQYWAGKGYFVIYCNPTGSDGRGEFMNILGKYGTVDYEDIMAFCDRALEAYPQMDKDNFFETGGSYGGFMTNWIIGHTDRFKACASQRSISNWISFYGVSDIGTEFAKDQCQGDIWPDPDKLWWHSPLKYADQVKTPTLFIHSFEDYRCPIDQGYQMYNALLNHGVESKMVLFKGENHDLSRTGKPKHRIRRLDEITNWFEDHKG